MKKISVILLTMVFLLARTACGNAATGNGNNDNNQGVVSDVVSNVQSSVSSVASDIDGNSTQSNASTGESQNATQNNAKITEEEALNIALKHAGVTKNDIQNLENRLETENGKLVYDIEFDSGNTEYSYDINAETGDIVDSDRDAKD